jgi:hypothetical protein
MKIKKDSLRKVRKSHVEPVVGILKSNPTTVISAMILDGKTTGSGDTITPETKILIGVRNPQTNLTHPGVVSTPTQRVPKSLFASILQLSKKNKRSFNFNSSFPEQIFDAYQLQAPLFDSQRQTGHNAVMYAVESLLVAKLGLAEPLQRAALHFTATPVVLLSGSTLYEIPGSVGGFINDRRQLKDHSLVVKRAGEPVMQEYIQMVCLKVIVDNADVFPSVTASYSEIKWITIAEFLIMTKRKDVTVLKGYFSEKTLDFCLHGICMLSSLAHLSFLKLTIDSP